MLVRSARIVALLALVASASFAGCKTSDSGASAPPREVVQCTQCRTIWIDGPHTYYSAWEATDAADKRHACPNCVDAVANFFRTGKLEHTCPTCGDGLAACRRAGR